MRSVFFHGYIALLTVLALLSFCLSLLVTIPASSLSGSSKALLMIQSEMLLSALEGCAEDALLQSVRHEDYNGSTHDYFGVRCDVTIEKNDTLWTLSFIGTKDDIRRTLRILVDRTPGTPGTLILQSWREE